MYTANQINKFREELWKLFRENSKGLRPEDVVDALYEASEEVWDAGLDRAYERIGKTSEVAATAFDFTWLTAVSIKLRQKKKANKRN